MTSDATDTTLPVSELFGPTIQGEGPASGRVAWFLRLGGCNLTCRDCDTPYTWDGRRYDLRAEIARRPAVDLIKQLTGARLLILTGGEPLLHQRSAALRLLVDAVTNSGEVHVETNGTVPPAGWLVDNPYVEFVVSPKLAGPMSQDPQHRRLVPDALTRWAELAAAGRASWKMVCRTPADVRAAVDLADQYQTPRSAVWVMPEGTTPGVVITRARGIADTALGHGLNISLRTHVLLWPTEPRGR